MTITSVAAFVVSFVLAASALAQPAAPATPAEQKKPSELAPMSLDLSHLGALAFDLGDMAAAVGAMHLDLGALDSLHALDGLKGLEGLSELQGLERLKELDTLEALDGLEELDALKAVTGLEALEGLNGLPRFAPGAPGVSELQDREQERQQREQEREERMRERVERQREVEQDAYEDAQEALDDGRYDRAIDRFGRVAAMKGTRADAALYWKAFAQDRQGQRAEALTTIAELLKNHPNSRYAAQAKALEVEVRRNVGQPVRPENQSDDELRLMALNALQHSDPDQAIPMLEQLLRGTASRRVKDRALFVLAQSNSPKARDVLTGIAKGSSTPELQTKAIQYLGIHGGRESRAALGEIYQSTADVDVKRRILRAFMVAGEKTRLFTAAQSEPNAELRAEAVRQLGVMSAHEELWQLYQKETSVDVKKQILQAMFVGGHSARMIDLAKSEQNAELRRAAVRNLGLMGSKATGQALVDIYNTEKDAAIRKTVVNALFLQDNATALVALARKEQTPELKKEIVEKLSHMDSKVATEYMLELLNGK